MKTKEQLFVATVDAFKAALMDQLEEQANVSGGTYTPSTDSLKAAAFPAMKEVVESSEGTEDEVSPMMAVAVWEAVLKVNESAFRQGLERMNKAGLLKFKLGGRVEVVKSMALSYV